MPDKLQSQKKKKFSRFFSWKALIIPLKQINQINHNHQNIQENKKKLIEKKMAKQNSKSVLSVTFNFDPEEYLNKSLLFDLKKQVKENFLME